MFNSLKIHGCCASAGGLPGGFLSSKETAILVARGAKPCVAFSDVPFLARAFQDTRTNSKRVRRPCRVRSTSGLRAWGRPGRTGRLAVARSVCSQVSGSASPRYLLSIVSRAVLTVIADALVRVSDVKVLEASTRRWADALRIGGPETAESLTQSLLPPLFGGDRTQHRKDYNIQRIIHIMEYITL